MAERIRRITRALEALKETDLERTRVGFALEAVEELLEFRAMTEVTRLHAVGGGEFPIVVELLGLRLLVDAVDVWLFAVLEMARDQLVGEKHQLLDELVGDVVLDQFELHGVTLLVEPDLNLGHLEIECPGREALLPQDGGAVPCLVDTASRLILGRFLEQREGLTVGQTGGAADDRASETDIPNGAVAVDLGKDAKGEPILVRAKTAESVGEIFR